MLNKKIERRIIYNFFRVIDDIVDDIPFPNNKVLFYSIVRQYYSIFFGGSYQKDKYTDLIKLYVSLHNKYSFEDSWIKDFFWSMSVDVENKKIISMDDFYKYIRGISEIVGVIWCRFYGIPQCFEPYSRYFTRGFAIADMVLDFSVDIHINRVHLPIFNKKLSNLSYKNFVENIVDFNIFIRRYLYLAKYWIHKSLGGMQYLKPLHRLVLLANIKIRKYHIYLINKQPLIIFNKKFRKKIKRNNFFYSIMFSYFLFVSLVTIMFDLLFAKGKN